MSAHAANRAVARQLRWGGLSAGSQSLPDMVPECAVSANNKET